MATTIVVRDVDAVRWITLDGPKTRNALQYDTLDALTTALQDAGSDDSVRVVVLTGAHGAFCSGLDLKFAMTAQQDPESGLVHFQNAAKALYYLDKPTIAAVDGPAAGFGADFALTCDIRIASETAKLGAKFVQLGLMTDGGGSFLLPRLVGRGRAFELLYTGRMVGADEGRDLGLFQDVLAADAFAAGVHAFAARLAEGPPLAFAAIKNAVRATSGDIEEAYRLEGEGQMRLIRSADFASAVQAWMTGTKPTFQGK